MHNLDRLAAQYAQAIVQSGDQQIETTVTKALGVLQEHGVYACFLYLLAKEKDNGKKVVVPAMLDLLDKLDFGWSKPHNDQPATILQHISDTVTADLERLLLAKEILEQMLIYARYGAKAQSKE
ncbi:hypothetical protein [Candidatus Viridilinea mediisalina]|uniref:CRISPR type III-B/RAMP module-associated protein Cmr5 n=1 Tax=Candidatus Viridilinea mediisalina TaxID=2024553 RepID=A0A2A6RGV0_9CHLR|nr:hypothetical protein [Candidatus Viridilinea mediisalina]PDW02163.1 hypothetical protein CJ255_15405 [Candidatus Viridilinea mediisalina]